MILIRTIASSEDAEKQNLNLASKGLYYLWFCIFHGSSQPWSVIDLQPIKDLAYQEKLC